MAPSDNSNPNNLGFNVNNGTEQEATFDLSDPKNLAHPPTAGGFGEYQAGIDAPAIQKNQFAVLGNAGSASQPNSSTMLLPSTHPEGAPPQPNIQALQDFQMYSQFLELKEKRKRRVMLWVAAGMMLVTGVALFYEKIDKLNKELVGQMNVDVVGQTQTLAKQIEKKLHTNILSGTNKPEKALPEKPHTPLIKVQQAETSMEVEPAHTQEKINFPNLQAFKTQIHDAYYAVTEYDYERMLVHLAIEPEDEILTAELRARLASKYVYQNYYATERSRKLYKRNLEQLLRESLNHEKFWTRMEALLALVERSAILSRADFSNVLKDTRKDLVLNYLERFAKDSKKQEQLIAKAFVAIGPEAIRAKAFRIVLNNDAESAKIFALLGQHDANAAIVKMSQNYLNKNSLTPEDEQKLREIFGNQPVFFPVASLD